VICGSRWAEIGHVNSDAASGATEANGECDHEFSLGRSTALQRLRSHRHILPFIKKKHTHWNIIMYIVLAFSLFLGPRDHFW
jgi:hypothetical protein